MKHVWIFSTISNPAQDSQDSDDKCDGYRGCGCAKNKCLSLNCQCFRAEQYCHQDCHCINCLNREKFKDQRQEAVAKAKVAREKSLFQTLMRDSQDSIPARGCGCGKNKCLNLNCQCFRDEKYCHPHCKCVNCQNREEFKDQRQKLLQEAIARAKIAKEKSLLPKKEKQLPAQKCSCEREVSIEKSCQRDENN